jgi:beta-lactamase superfamily II metal-dependent hydrolase
MNVPLATFNGVDVDMLNVGDADSILVTRWTNGMATRVLIDGGNKGSAATVKAFLLNRHIQYLDHIVCTHPHDDHAAGLIELVTDKRFDFGTFWMHLPWKHVNLQTLHEALRTTSATRVAKIINESLETSSELANAVWQRKELIYQPFSGIQIGFLTVCGPSQSLYQRLVADFSDMDRLADFENVLAAHERKMMAERVSELFGDNLADGALGAEPTEPENDSSVILATQFGSDVLLFTGDAGLPALYAAANAFPGLRSCRWMQIPHHGSRRNINEELIKFFCPKAAFVSADGTRKHPRKKVVTAFQNGGTEVFSTHYPDGNHLWYHTGVVPIRADYGPAVSLYN